MTLIKIPADIPVIEGARFRGTHFEPTTKDNKPLKPYVNISTQQGTVKKYINYPLREDTTAYVIGDKVSVSALTGDIHYPDSQTVTVGTLETGTVADLQLTDGTMVQVSETTGTPGFDVRYPFSGLHQTTPGRVVLEGYYNGNHSVASQVWNYTTESWDTLGTLPSAASVGEHVFSGLTSDNVSGGAGIFRLYHSDPGNINHSVFVDGLRVEEAADGTTELYLEATAGGTSNGTSPTFSADQIGTEVEDDSVTWKVMGYHTLEGPRIEGAATNYLDTPGTPATQTTASLGTGTYCLWVEGTGDAAVSANTATITGAGTATEGTPVVFTVTGAGTVDVTVTGSLDFFQLEGNGFPTSHIYGGTRLSDIVTAPWPNGVANNWFAQLRVKPLGSQDGTYAWASRSDADNLVAILMQTASITFRKKVASTDTDVSVTYTHGTNMIDLDFYNHSTGMGIRYREFDGSWGAWSAWQTVTTAAGKADAVPGSVFSLGALYEGGTTTSGHHHGNYAWKEIGQFPTGTADPQAYMEAL